MVSFSYCSAYILQPLSIRPLEGVAFSGRYAHDVCGNTRKLAGVVNSAEVHGMGLASKMREDNPSLSLGSNAKESLAVLLGSGAAP